MLSPHPGRPRWNVVAFPATAIRHRIPPPEPERRPWRPAIVLAWLLVATVLVLALGVLGAAWWTVHRLSSRIERVPDAFRIPAAERPARAAGAGRSLNLLVAGLDGEQGTVVERGVRSDAIMVLHLDADRRHAWVVSIPRDAWVPIPGHGDDKVNAAYSIGGPPLFVRTIEGLTGLRMDHLVVLDRMGIRRLTDAVGGVPLSVLLPSAATTDPPRGDVALEFSGEDAVPYLSERKHLPAGDLDRVKRQQHYLRALVRQALARGTFADPGALRAIADAVGDAVRVDGGFTTREMLALAASARGLRARDITFLTAPTRGPEMRGDADVLVYDHENADSLWRAVADDRVDAFVAAHPDLVTDEHVR